MKKRIGSLLLILALCFTLLPTAAFAAETMDTWDGTADTSWYDENETKFHLKAAKQLAGMAKLVNDNTANFKDKTVYLDNNLDLGGHEWISIGNGANTAWGSFQGIFDGQSHVVYNLYSHEGLKSENKDNNNNLYRNGLFGAIYNATVQNLGIENADIVIPMNDTSTYGKGILVDWMTNSTIKNCYTTGSITGGSYIEKFIGGIAGFLNGNNSISQCYSTAAITGNYDGEYYKEQEGGLEPMDCWDSLGGIVGASYTGQVTISDCWFGGEIVVNSIQAPVGGIIGFGQGVSMVNCLVATKGIGNDGLENTCWLGYVVNTDAKNCFWPADDRYGSNVSNEQNGNSAGTATNDFNSDDVLVGLQAKAGSDVEWVSGIGHPTFAWDDNNILADYTAVNEAIAAAEKFDKTLYSNYADVEAAINAVDRTKSKAEQAEVDAMAQAIEKAINALVRKSSGGDDSDPTYAIEVNKDIQNGEVTVNRRYAERGDTVTITVKPDNGFKLDELTVIDKNGNELKLTDKGNGKYTFTMPASKVEIKATFVKEVETSPFSDVSTSAYYYEAVKWAQEKGITGGIGNGLFGPNQPCTRAQIVTFLWRAAGSPEPKTMSSFADVSMDAYYAKAVAWAVENSITTGTGDGKFSPDATCTREQAVAFLYRASGSPAVSGGSAFSDVAANAYYADAVAWAEKNGVTGGIGGGLFGSGNTCTRAQIVTFLYRAYQGK
ncbi:MAG: S-layer homology domain-containing protein [Oscillospiraceae bacterium]|nr:S-layer homology domain-containing protein [Oscillospiraceae bacterium]